MLPFFVTPVDDRTGKALISGLIRVGTYPALLNGDAQQPHENDSKQELDEAGTPPVAICRKETEDMSRILNRRRGQKGFTLIELLIVVAIIGIIAAILIPNLLDALQKAKQKRTMGDIRNVGTAWFSWFQDQVGAAAAGTGGTGTYEFGNLTALSSDALLQTLYVSNTMFYIQDVPQKDGWGSDYEYAAGADLSAVQVMGIRSPGRQGTFETDSYQMGPFIATQYEQDIVWADGFFVRYPAGAQVVSQTTTP
jgi:type II secretion system protein G